MFKAGLARVGAGGWAGSRLVLALAAVVALVGFVPTTATADAGSPAVEPSFGGDGLVTSVYGGADGMVTAIVVQHDGKLVVTASGDSVSSAGMLARYSSDGFLDPGFGHGGTADISDLFIPTAGGPVVLQPEGS